MSALDAFHCFMFLSFLDSQTLHSRVGIVHKKCNVNHNCNFKFSSNGFKSKKKQRKLLLIINSKQNKIKTTKKYSVINLAKETQN
jgi:hypothetical protein